MGAAERELFGLLKQYGFELIRGKKHKVYKNRQGKTLVLSSTPSDEGWAENALHNLKNCLGIGSQGKEAVVGDRRQKRNRPEKHCPVSSSLMGPRLFARNPTLQDQLVTIIPTLFSGVPAAALVPSPRPVEGNSPCARCGGHIRLTVGYRTAMRERFGDKWIAPTLCRTCKNLIDGVHLSIRTTQLQKGDRVIKCQGCSNEILFTRKQQDDFLVKGKPERKFCRKCHTRVGRCTQITEPRPLNDFEPYFVSQGAI